MAAPTSAEIVVDKVEYSRCESGRDTVTATLVISGGAPYSSEEVLVEMVKARRNRDAVVGLATITLVEATDPVTKTVEFDLNELQDQDEINLVRRGEYFIRATSITSGTVIGESPDFRVTILTVERLKNDWLFGIPLKSTQVKEVKGGIKMPGLEVCELSPNHPLGFYQLIYNYVDDGSGNVVRTLSWNGGPSVTITGPGKYFLPVGSSGPASKICGGVSGNKEYLCVVVQSLAFLPTENTTEQLLIDFKEITDDALRDYIDNAIDMIENNWLQIHIEPTNVVTDPDPTALQFQGGPNPPTVDFIDTDFDEIVSPLTYFANQRGGGWIPIQFPHPQILRVDNLFGAIANVRVIDIDLNWIELSQQSGFTQLVPFNQEIAFNFIGLLWVNAVRGATDLPNFWHYNAIVGLRKPSGDIQELIGKQAAITALTELGLAFRPGIGSLSLGRDGVSQSVSYTNQAQFGIYSGTITAFKSWIDENLPKMRAKYRGAIMRFV